MRNAGVLESLRELDQVLLAINGEDDGMRVVGQVAPAGLAGGMDELGREVPER